MTSAWSATVLPLALAKLGLINNNSYRVVLKKILWSFKLMKKKENNKSRFGFKLALLGLFLASISLAGIGVVSVLILAIDDLPNLDTLKNYQPLQSTVVYDRNQEVVGRFYDERRTVIAVDKLPAHVIDAFVAAEDGAFFEHHGLDYAGLLRAVFLEIKYRFVGGRRVGGSTITQQTARAMLLTSNQTYIRKLKEILLARRIEQALTKEQILHLYLNQIYFGNGAYGIEEAALTYFNKPARYLQLFESAALASIPKSPNRINPFGDTVRLKERQAYVLEQMVKLGFIDESEALKAKKSLLFSASMGSSKKMVAPYFLSALKADLTQKIGEDKVKLGGLKVYSSLDLPMQIAAEKAFKNGIEDIDKRAGFRGPLLRPEAEQSSQINEKLGVFKTEAFKEANKKKIWDLRRLNKNSIKGNLDSLIANTRVLEPEDDLKIAVLVKGVDEAQGKVILDLGSKTIFMPETGWAWAKDKNHQKLSDIVQAGDIILVKLHNLSKGMWASLEQKPLINGGLVALDVENGGILAMVGGYDFDSSSFNRIMQAKRQPGSGIKPLIYSLALDKEMVTAASIITDAPKAFLDPGTEEYWKPRNHTKKYLGDITLRRCLRSSINICTITLLERLGLDSFLGLSREVELLKPQTPFPRNLTIALGSAEVYPIDLANAMRILPNQGAYTGYHMTTAIKYSKTDFEQFEQKSPKQIIRPETSYIVTSILSDVISPYNRAKYLFNVKSALAGKTGTTNQARSVWFFGYSPKVLTLVFVGYDDNRSVGSNEWGVTTAFPIWANFMNEVKEHQEELAFNIPENLEYQTIDPQTGKAIKEPNLEETSSSSASFSPHFKEIFIANTAPKIIEQDSEEGSESTRVQALDNAAFAP